MKINKDTNALKYYTTTFYRKWLEIVGYVEKRTKQVATKVVIGVKSFNSLDFPKIIPSIGIQL